MQSKLLEDQIKETQGIKQIKTNHDKKIEHPQ